MLRVSLAGGHMLLLGGRWSSDLQSDRSLTPPLTVMAVELSGDTGAVIQPHIHVQSAWGDTHPVTIIMTEVLRHSFRSGADVPQVFSLIGLGFLKSHCHFSWLHCFKAQRNFLVFAVHILLALRGVRAICARHHPVGIPVAPYCIMHLWFAIRDEFFFFHSGYNQVLFFWINVLTNASLLPPSFVNWKPFLNE